MEALAGLFDGPFADNIRISPSSDKTLRESMKQFGWIAEFPALVDENELVLVGHRRLAIAKELNIKPVIKMLDLGKGDDATAEKLKIAIASNIGGAPLTMADRKHIANHLYGIQRWTLTRIARALNSKKSTIADDLVNFPVVGKLKPAKTKTNPRGAGRPKGSKGATKARLGNGYSTIGEAAAAGIKMERAGADQTTAVKKSGLGRQTYSIARDILLLADRDDLSKKDAALVSQALAQLNENHGIAAPYELVKPIVTKMWGKKGIRFTSDKKRTENFFESIAGVAAGCMAISTELPIPYLGADQQAEALETIREAKDALDVFINRIKEGGLK